MVVVPVAASAQGLTCRASVTGVDSHGRLHMRNVVNNHVRTDRVSKPLPFPVKQQGAFAQDHSKSGYTLYTRAISHHTPRTLTIKVSTADKRHIRVSTTSFQSQQFAPKLFTASYGFHDYAVAGGTFGRVTTYRNPSNHNKLYFDNLIVLRRHLHLRALAYYGRVKVHGQKADIMFATTKSGGLMTIHVPVKHPKKASFRVVKKHGFGRYSGLSLAGCNGKRLGVVAVDAGANYARMFVIGNALHPKGTTVHPVAKFGKGHNWRLHALL